MASKASIRHFCALGEPLRPLSRRLQHRIPQRQTFSTAPRRRQEIDTVAAPRPRWQQTPPGMKAPVRSRPLPENNDFQVNDDPSKLDAAYVRTLGRDGDKMLPEEIKWLAVTHKSFDHGRRGFNDRLAYLGKRIVDLQTSLALLSSPQPTASRTDAGADAYGRTPFSHPALASLNALTSEHKHLVTHKSRLANLAEQYGLPAVTRWKPKNAHNLQGSGQDVVLAQTLYAIVGAVALQKGGEVAKRVARERVLGPLGVS